MPRENDIVLAELVREHLRHLDETLLTLVSRGEPISALEARLLLELAAARLSPVEAELRRRPVSKWERAAELARRRRLKLRAWLSPRIGNLSHYPPKPIRLPSSYFRATPPDPAPTISLVTPSYQQGHFLERTMASVLGQNYPGLEYHVQDGGSTDATVEILDRHGQLLSGWASERDQGQADAINRAFASTTGELMAWLNSDDLLLPGALARVARAFVEHPEVDVVYGNRLMIDANDGQIGAWILPQHDDEALTLADFIPQETLFWRRRVWDAAGGRLDDTFSYALDWDLLLRFRSAGARMLHLPHYLGAFRVHDEQKTSASLAVGLEEMALLRDRVHGRHVPLEEVLQRLQPYFRRHRVRHAWQRVLDRLPLPTETYCVTGTPQNGPTPANLLSGSSQNRSAPDQGPAGVHVQVSHRRAGDTGQPEGG